LTFMMVSYFLLVCIQISFVVTAFWASFTSFFLSFSSIQVYVWSKQNPFIHMSFLGIFTFTAAYLPWVSKLLPMLHVIFF
jgi:Derlin-2/3